MALTSGQLPSSAETSSPLAACGQSRRATRGRRRWRSTSGAVSPSRAKKVRQLSSTLLGRSCSGRRAPRCSRRCRRRGTRSARTFRSFLVGSSCLRSGELPVFPSCLSASGAPNPPRAAECIAPHEFSIDVNRAGQSQSGSGLQLFRERLADPRGRTRHLDAGALPSPRSCLRRRPYRPKLRRQHGPWCGPWVP